MDLERIAQLTLRTEALHGSSNAPDILGDLFDLQRALAVDPSRKKVALCSRRSGKTVAASYILINALNRASLDTVIVYAAKTRLLAKGLVWEKLKAINRAFQLGLQFREVDLQVVSPTGGAIWVVGLDKEAEIEKLRGIKSSLVVLDEPATYASLISKLVAQVLEPALGDLRGTLCVVGTPGIVPSGWWYHVSSGQAKGWSRHAWTILQNPYFPDPEEYLAERLELNGWTTEHPTYIREDTGQWVSDEGDLVYKYHPGRNACRTVPDDLDSYAVAADFGLRDETAIVVLGWKEGEHAIYAVECMKQGDLLPEEAAAHLKSYVDKYDPRILVGDANGIGAAYVEEFNRRYSAGRKMEPAKKLEKRSFISLINADFRTGRLKIHEQDCSSLIEELQLAAWDERRQGVAPGCDDHACDALLYCWRHATHYRNAHTNKRRYNPWDFEQLLLDEDEEFQLAEAQRPWWDR